MNANLYSYFKMQSDNILLHLDDVNKLSYKEVDSKVSRYCNLFKSINLEKGDRVAVQTEKCIDALYVYLACIKSGYIYIPLNPAFKAHELEYFIKDATPSLFICSPDKFKTLNDIADRLDFSLQIETLSQNNKESLQEKATTYSRTFNTISVEPNDIACILYTSGTTGDPKGAMLTHKNLLTNACDLVATWHFTSDDVLLHMLPIFHCHGLFFACHTTLLSGAGMFFRPKLDIDDAIKLLPKSSVFMGVPTYYTRLLSHPNFNSEITKSMRLFISGSAPLLEKTFNAFYESVGKKILERYGMTETGIIASNPFDGERLSGTVGLPIGLNQVRITDETGNVLENNNIGIVEIRGDNVFCGYWKNESKTQSSFTKDGYFKTGDIGVFNNAHYLQIVGREKDMIITGGMNVYPKELEQFLDQQDGVIESAIIGLSHEDYGEAVTAVLACKKNIKIDIDNLNHILKENFANYKQPKAFIFVDMLPKNAMGKVQKNVLRERYKKHFLSYVS